MLLEPHAASLAAVRGDAEMVAKLKASNAEMAAAIAAVGGSDGQAAIARIQEANKAFHHALLDHAGSPRLKAMLDTMIDMPIIVRSFYLYERAELEQSLHHHQDLTLAAEARDGELARQVMQLHLRMSYHRFMKHRGEYRPRP